MLAKDTLGNRVWDAQEMMRFSMEAVSPPLGGCLGQTLLCRLLATDAQRVRWSPFPGTLPEANCISYSPQPKIGSRRDPKEGTFGKHRKEKELLIPAG